MYQIFINISRWVPPVTSEVRHTLYPAYFYAYFSLMKMEVKPLSDKS